MRIERTERGGMAFLKVTGELRYEDRESFVLAVGQAVEETDTEVVLDLLDVNQFGHNQVAILIASRRAMSAPKLFVYLVLRPKAKRVLAYMQLEYCEQLWQALYSEPDQSVSVAT